MDDCQSLQQLWCIFDVAEIDSCSDCILVGIASFVVGDWMWSWSAGDVCFASVSR